MRRRPTSSSAARGATATAAPSTAASAPLHSSGTYALPSFWALFLPLLVVRLVAALTCPIADCDETFNYFEPLHYLLHGSGLQTWEYSPQYGLRSYAYIALHAPPALLAKLFTSSRPAQFYAVRCSLAAASALCEAFFARRVALAAGTPVAWLTWSLLTTSAGMYHAAVAFLPSSFAMLLLMNAWSAWIVGDFAIAIWCVATSAILGWPFAAVVACGPLALDAMAHIGPARFVKHALCAAAALIVPSAALDSWLYGRPILAFLNILLYNSSASSGAGAQLYGVEPWHYYLQNLALNFNAALLAALAAPPLLVAQAVIERSSKGGGSDGAALPPLRILLVLSGLYAWLLFFSAVPHKEERFMYPVYPLLCFGAAVAIRAIARALAHVCLPPAAGRSARTGLCGAAAALCALISAMRATGQATYYAAPLQLYSRLYHRATGTGGGAAVVCVGNEWYRYASSFFLPEGARLAFVRDGFDGQLPAHYSAPLPAGSRAIHAHFNDMNREEPSRYVPLPTCDWLVDLLPADGAPDEAARRHLQKGFRSWQTVPFLDAPRSPAWSRALYVPFVSDTRNAYVEYALMQRR